jgi:hypothetical protein
MRNSIRLSVGAAIFAALAACSSPAAQPAMSDDLKQDLAKVGGGDVQLAGASSSRLQVVSAAERTDRNVPAPKAPSVTRIASTNRGTRAVVRSARHVSPVPAQAMEHAVDVAPAEAPRADPAPEPVQSQRRPQQAPLPAQQREPRGGWKSEGEVFRNAPFPINP